MPFVRSVMELCGNTPVVRLQRISGNVYLKLESFNPGKSIKDRPVLEMMEEAERSGRLRGGMTIVESTSGNTGIAIALYGRKKGYRVRCIVDENIPTEKLKLMQAYGAEVEMIKSDGHIKNADLTESRITRVKSLLQESDQYINFNQYNNECNSAAHEKYTAEEILLQAPDDLKAVVLSVGTGGSITGVSRKIKQKRPDILIYGVEPSGSTLFGERKVLIYSKDPATTSSLLCWIIPSLMTIGK